MSSVKITINGVICDMYGRTITGPVKIVGEAMYTDLGVGGGPIPPGGGGGDEGPPHIWGPPDMPPGFWGGGMGPGVKPQPPIPPKPVEPPADGQSKPPPEEGGWGYWAGDGVDSWVLKPRPGIDPQPKA